MQTYAEIAPLRTKLAERRAQKERIGLVPTMGALHGGHRALLTRSLRDNDHTVCSIYVNPTQFNNPDDLLHYPRTLEEDTVLLRELGCDSLFCPTDAVMYPGGLTDGVRMDFGSLERVLEGIHRPGHFGGVGAAVSKLFHVVQPDRAYFGQKDLQQFAVIHKLVRELLFPVQLIRVPSVRSAEGLALSSRNRLLSVEQQQTARHLYRALTIARTALVDGEPVVQAQRTAVNHLAEVPEIRLEYLEIVDADTFAPVADLAQPRPVAICVAAYVGAVRLIDNVLLDLK